VKNGEILSKKGKERMKIIMEIRIRMRDKRSKVELSSGLAAKWISILVTTSRKKI